MNIETIGITGGKGHGKDTFARIFRCFDSEYQVVSFAEPLKQIVSRVFAIDRNLMNELEDKERLFVEAIYIDDYLYGLRNETGLDIIAHDMWATSIRELLQFVGTDYVRSIDPDYWVRRASNEFPEGKKLIPDIRFPNELQYSNGYIVKTICLDKPTSTDTHASETSIDENDVDLVIGARYGKLQVMEYAAVSILRKKEKDLWWLDYRNVPIFMAEYNALSRESKDLFFDTLPPDTNQTLIRLLVAYYS